MQRWFSLWRLWNFIGTLLLIIQVAVAVTCFMIQNNDKIQHGENPQFLSLFLSLSIVKYDYLLMFEVREDEVRISTVTLMTDELKALLTQA